MSLGLYALSASTNYESIYNRSKTHSDIFAKSVGNLMSHVYRSFVWVVVNTCKFNLYHYRKVHAIKEVAVDKPKYSIYQRSQIYI